jgi:isoleucyl-tRNA synthetase
LWNVFSFFTTYAKIDNYDPGKSSSEVKSRNQIDLWLLSRLNQIVKVVKENMDNYDYFTAATAVDDFVIRDLSNWYIRINRRRFWKTEQTEDKLYGYDTLYETLTVLSKLIAPFTPFISEYFYQKLERSADSSDPESIHLTEFPKFDETLINPELENELNRIRNIVEAGRSARSSSNLKIRQPLSNVVCVTTSPIENENLIDIIKTELNVKNVDFKKDMEWAKNYKVKVNMKRVGPKFKKDLPAILAQLEKEPVDPIKSQLDQTGTYKFRLDKLDIELSKEDILLEELIPEDYSIGKIDDITVLLDTAITPELKNEAVAREIVRRVQVMRKDMDLDYAANINIRYSSPEAITSAISAFSDYIQNETLSKTLDNAESIEEIENIRKDKEFKINTTRLKSEGGQALAVWVLEEGEIQIEITKV